MVYNQDGMVQPRRPRLASHLPELFFCFCPKLLGGSLGGLGCLVFFRHAKLGESFGRLMPRCRHAGRARAPAQRQELPLHSVCRVQRAGAEAGGAAELPVPLRALTASGQRIFRP